MLTAGSKGRSWCGRSGAPTAGRRRVTRKRRNGLRRPKIRLINSLDGVDDWREECRGDQGTNLARLDILDDLDRLDYLELRSRRTRLSPGGG